MHPGCYHKSVAVMHFVNIDTFLWVALQRKIACRREEIVVKAVFLPCGWRLVAIPQRACFISKGYRQRVGDLGGVVQAQEQAASCRSKQQSEKMYFLHRHFRQHLTRSHFYREPCGLG